MVMIVVMVVVVIMGVMIMGVIAMPVIVHLMLMTLVGDHVMLMMFGIDRMFVPFMELRRLRVGVGTLDHLALHAIALAAAAGVAVARPAAVMAAVLMLFLGFAVCALVGLDQRLTVGDRDLVVVGMDFAEGEEAVTIAAIFDEGGL
jgi:hypothetical protein